MRLRIAELGRMLMAALMPPLPPLEPVVVEPGRVEYRRYRARLQRGIHTGSQRGR
jgi:hypothetical protein